MAWEQKSLVASLNCSDQRESKPKWTLSASISVSFKFSGLGT